MIDAYKYIKSKDMKEAFKTENYEFSPLEIAYLVTFSGLSLEAQMKEFKILLDETEDFTLPYGYNRDLFYGPNCSFHEFLRYQIKTYDSLIEQIRSLCDAHYYVYCDNQEIEVCSVESALALANFENYPSVFIRGVSLEDCEYRHDYNQNKELINISVSANNKELKIFEAFPKFIYHWPSPFKQGDVVKNVLSGKYKIITETQADYTDEELDSLIKSESSFIFKDFSSRIGLADYKPVDECTESSIITQTHGHTIVYEKVKVDKIDFELTNALDDALYLEEDYDKEYMKNYKVCKIIINGQEIRDIIKETELAYYEENWPEGCEIAGHYIHVSPQKLYDDLMGLNPWSNPFDQDSEDSEGANLLVCGSCGFAGCSDINVYIRTDENFVYWENMYCSTEQDIQFENYQFAKEEYQKAMLKLHNFAKEKEV